MSAAISGMTNKHSLDRRRFLQIAGGTVALSALSSSVARAASIAPATRTRTIKDVEHIVVLMQENRSFDHYFGSLRGVRGFGDPHPVIQPSGQPVWNQTGVLPFRPAVPSGSSDLGLVFLEDLAHGWQDTHQAWNNGNWDRWVPAKTKPTMAYLNRDDIPFHYALADAFTICDNYFCSTLTSTDPNRYYLWTGFTGNDGQNGGPVLNNAEKGYGWTTYPERLEAAGVSWKVYQDIGKGLDAPGVWGFTSDAYIGNFGDNSLLYFNQYRNATPGDAALRQGQDRHEHRQDRRAVRHPGRGREERRAAAGVLDRRPRGVLRAPELARQLRRLVRLAGAGRADRQPGRVEQDRADHLLRRERRVLRPPGPAVPGVRDGPGRVHRLHQPGAVRRRPGFVAGPYGLGPRVPMMVISPWSRGGWVCSEVFDATSVIQFIERRFGVPEPHISAWRRAVCGDLTSAFDFRQQNASVPSLPSTAAYVPPDNLRHHSVIPVPPSPGPCPRRNPACARPGPCPTTCAPTARCRAGT